MGKIRELYRDRYFSLVGDQEGVHYVRSHDSVLVVPVTSDGEVILVREPSPAFGTLAYVLPGGTLGSTESITDAAQRELQAGTGFKADSIVMLGELRPCVKYLQVRTFLYLARHLHPSAPPGEDEASALVKRLPLAQFEVLITQAALHDSNTIAALYLARSYLSPFSPSS